MSGGYFWRKEAMMQAPGDYTKAKQFHFQHTPDGRAPRIRTGRLEVVSRLALLRCWVAFWAQPVRRRLDQFSYNDMGNVTRHIDSQGRITNCTFAANQIDLCRFRSRLVGSAIDTVIKAIYNTQHLPLTIKCSGPRTVMPRNDAVEEFLKLARYYPILNYGNFDYY